MVKLKQQKTQALTGFAQNQKNQVRRFRGSIYVDLLIDSSDAVNLDRQRALEQLDLYADKIPNSFVGGVAMYDPQNIEKPLDREI